jgi:hypothetical protein
MVNCLIILYFFATVNACYCQSYSLVKARSSTNLCSMIWKESMAYYVNRQSSVFCKFLDASKAFNRLKYCKLVKLLVSRQVPPPIIRLLINFYTGILYALRGAALSLIIF